MKKITLFALLFVATLMGTQSAKAQQNVIKVNYISPIFKTAAFFYERAINEKSSMQLGLLYTGFKVAGTKLQGFAVTPEYRFYLSQKEAPAGFFLGPYVKYQNYKLTQSMEGFSDTDVTGKIQSFGGGLLVGHQWIFAERVSLEFFLGPSFNAAQVRYEDENHQGDNNLKGTGSGFGLRAGTTIGIAF